MQRIYAGVFGSGLGHVARVYLVAKELEKEYGAEFLYSTFYEALDFLRKHGEKVIRSPSLGVKWNIGGGFSARETSIRFPVPMLGFSKQIAFERESPNSIQK